MKLEDEIWKIIKGLEDRDLYYIDPRRSDNAKKEIQSLIKRYCKRQREIDSRMVSGWPDKVYLESEIEERILTAKLATEVNEQLKPVED